MQGTLGCIMEAPAATAYAVLPVGVEMIRPVEKNGIKIHYTDTKIDHIT